MYSPLFHSEKCTYTVTVDEFVYILRCCAVHHNCGNTCFGGNFCRVYLGYHTACTSVGTRTAAESFYIIVYIFDYGDKSCIGVFVGVIVEKTVDV